MSVWRTTDNLKAVSLYASTNHKAQPAILYVTKGCGVMQNYKAIYRENRLKTACLELVEHFHLHSITLSRG